MAASCELRQLRAYAYRFRDRAPSRGGTWGRSSTVGPALLVLAGVAMMLAGFKTDPDLSGGPQIWHGLIHGLAYFLFVFSLLPAFFLLWWRFRRDPL
jgi:predicted cobalt transporter CbtA